MRLLAIETSGQECGAALAVDGRVVAECRVDNPMELLQRLALEIRAMLGRAELSLQDVDAFAVDLGPGAFTGLRIGVMTAKAWAHTLQRPLVCACSLDLLADEHGSAETPLLTVVRSRFGTGYARLYDAGRIVAPRDGGILCDDLAGIADLVAATGTERALMVGDAVARHGDAIRGELAKRGIEGLVGPGTAPSARALALRAVGQAERGDFADPATVAPLYVAPPPATPNLRTAKPVAGTGGSGR